MIVKIVFSLAAATFLIAQDTPRELVSLKYIDLVEGSGAPAVAGKRFTVHYTGWLKDGTKFDSSVDRKEPFTFVQGRRQVITGWDIGFEGMKIGGRRKLFIPYQLAYGETGAGPIPPKADLIFEVELLDVTDAPVISPAVDVILPWSDLEAKVTSLAKSLSTAQFEAAAPLLRSMLALTHSIGASTSREEPDVKSRDELIALLAAGFSDVRKRMESARAGALGADATLAGQATTRRGLYVELIRQIAELYGRAPEMSR